MALKDWQQWRNDFDYLTWQNKITKEEIRLARYRGVWSLLIVDRDNRPIDHLEDLTKANAIRQAKKYMAEN